MRSLEFYIKASHRILAPPTSFISLGRHKEVLFFYLIAFQQLQRSFEEAGVLSRALPFSIRTPDLGAELLRVLNKARGLSRGKFSILT